TVRSSTEPADYFQHGPLLVYSVTHRSWSAGDHAIARAYRFSVPGWRQRAAGQPVERPLQDERGGVLIDHPGAAGAPDICRDQLAFHRRRRQPLVPERDRKLGQPREIARKG